MNDAQNLHAVEERKIEDQNPFKVFNPKDSQLFKARMTEAGLPAHVWLRSEKSKRVMRGYEEAMADFGARRGGVVVGLIF